MAQPDIVGRFRRRHHSIREPVKFTKLVFGLAFSTLNVTAATVTDDTGRTLDLEQPAQRVIALSPHTAELLMYLNGGSHLLAAPAYGGSLPPHTRTINTLGGIDRERTLQLLPDLVLAWDSGNRQSDLAWLEKQGIPIFRSEPRNMAAIAANLRAIGKLVGLSHQGELAARRFEESLETSCAGAGQQEVYLAVWDTPALSVGGEHWLNSALRHAQLRNTFAEVPKGVFPVEREALFDKSELMQIVPGTAGTGTEAQRLYLPQLSRPGPAILQAVERLCEHHRPSSDRGPENVIPR
jgi:iron complex transport system substrate-binding protein